MRPFTRHLARATGMPEMGQYRDLRAPSGAHRRRTPEVWQGSGSAAMGRRADAGAVVVRVDPRDVRPAERGTLLGDPAQAHRKQGWRPTIPLRQGLADTVADYIESWKVVREVRL